MSSSDSVDNYFTVYNYTRGKKNWQRTQRKLAERFLFYVPNGRYIEWAGSSVGIATGYGLDGPGIESRWG
jgi:hypothetical protein